MAEIKGIDVSRWNGTSTGKLLLVMEWASLS